MTEDMEILIADTLIDLLDMSELNASSTMRELLQDGARAAQPVAGPWTGFWGGFERIKAGTDEVAARVSTATYKEHGYYRCRIYHKYTDMTHAVDEKPTLAEAQAWCDGVLEGLGWRIQHA